MTLLPSFVTAKVLTAQDPRLLSGKGYVEKAGADGQCTLSLSSGKITVRCSPGSLSEGDIVFVKVQGKDLIIEKMPSQGNGAVHDACDLHRPNTPFPIGVSGLSDPLTQRSGAGGINTVIPLQGESMPAEGFYYFDTAEKALSWLSKFSTVFDKEDQRAILQKFAHEPVVIQVVATGDEGKKALFLPRESFDDRLSLFIQERLQSGQWATLQKDGSLTALLQDRGALSFERMCALDAAFPEGGRPKAGQSIVGAEASETFSSMGKSGQAQLLVQWLNIAMDETTPLSFFSLCPSPLPSAGLPPLLEKIQSARQGGAPGGFSQPFPLSDVSISQAIAENLQEKATILPRILERIGIDCEHSLLSQEASDAETEAPLKNLKLLLLKMGSELNVILSQKDDTASGHPLFSLYRAAGELSAAWIRDLGKLMNGFFPSMAALSSQETDAPSQAQDPPGRVIDSFRQWATAMKALCEGIAKEISDQVEKLQEAIGLFDSTRKDLAKAAFPAAADRKNAAIDETVADIGSSARSIVPRAAAAFIKMTNELDAALARLSNRLASLAEETAISRLQGDLSRKSTAGQAGPENPAHVRPQLQAQTAMREIALQASTQLRALSGQIDHIVRQSSKLLDASDLGGALRDGKVAMEMTRQLVENALHRIESMQVSAKPTVSGDVRQQVVMVPMNIDGKWNDVIMKFVRADGQGGKKSGRKNIFVTINVAPDFLGEITASIDYKGIKNCSIRMDFDEDRTLSWFEANRQGLAAALGNLGFQNIKMDMHKCARGRSPVRSGRMTASNAAIDIVI